MKLRRFGFVLLTLLLAAVGYLRFPAYALPSAASGPETSGAPQIGRFSASSPVLTAGEGLTLSWRVSGAPPLRLQLVSAGRVRAVEGEAVRLEPTLSGRYTLVAQNRRGSHQRDRFVEVRAAAPPAGGTRARPVTGGGVAETSPEGSTPGDTGTGGTSEEDSRPEGSFGVSLNPDGPFVNDAVGGISDPDDERILRVAPGGEFFAEVSYEDPDGIASVALNLVNSSPDDLAGTLSPDKPPFSVVGVPTGTCNLGRLPTAVRCVYRVAVAEDARNISELPDAGDEFAYVFRVRVNDGLGNVANEPVRGYVAVSEP